MQAIDITIVLHGFYNGNICMIEQKCDYRRINMESLNINKYNKEEGLIIFKIYQVLGEEMKKIILAAIFVAIVVVLYLLNPLFAILAAVLGVFVLLKF